MIIIRVLPICECTFLLEGELRLWVAHEHFASNKDSDTTLDSDFIARVFPDGETAR
jgi:hypothetical protein